MRYIHYGKRAQRKADRARTKKWRRSFLGMQIASETGPKQCETEHPCPEMTAATFCFGQHRSRRTRVRRHTNDACGTWSAMGMGVSMEAVLRVNVENTA